MAEIGQIGTYKGQRVRFDGYENGEAKYTPIFEEDSTVDMSESGASFWERAKAGLADDAPESQLAAWQNIRGADNVKRDAQGNILVKNQGVWQPAEGEGLELADIADYSGELLEDIGQTIGAAKGAVAGAATGGLTLPATIAGGAMIGEGAGSAVREGLGRAFGVIDDSATDTLARIGGDVAMAPVETAVGGLIGKGVSKAAKVAKPFIKPVKTAGAVRDFILRGVSAVDDYAIDAMKRDPDRLLQVAKGGDSGADKMAMDAFKSMEQKAADKVSTLGKAVGDFVSENFDELDPVDSITLKESVEAILDQARIPIKGKAPHSTLQTDAEVKKLQKWAQAMIDSPSVLALRDLRMGMDDVIFDHGRGSSGFKAIQEQLRGVAEGEIEATAARKGVDVLDGYLAVKEPYAEAANVKNIVQSYFEDTIQDEAVSKNMVKRAQQAMQQARNLYEPHQAAHLENFRRLKELAPELADDINTIEFYAPARQFNSWVGGKGGMGPDRMAAQSIGGAASAAGLYMGGAGGAAIVPPLVVAGTRPRVLKNPVAASVKAGKALQEIGEKPLFSQIGTGKQAIEKGYDIATEAASPIIGREIAKGGMSALGGGIGKIGEVAPAPSDEAILQKAEAIGKENYSANYMRERDNFDTDREAAINALDISNKNKRDAKLRELFANEIRQFEQAGIDGFERIKTILGVQ